MKKRLHLGRVLEQQAVAIADRPFLTIIDDSQVWSFGEFDREVNRVANGLSTFGVGDGQFVGLMMRNSLPFLLSSYALKKLGAVEVAINCDFRGNSLARMINLSKSPILIIDEYLLEELGRVSAQLTHLKSVFVVAGIGSGRNRFAPWETHSFSDLRSHKTTSPDIEYSDSDTAFVMFSSGTTGLSKGLLLSHRYALRNAEGVAESYNIGPDDIVYTPWPLHHFGSAICEVLPALITGSQVVLRKRLSVSNFWPEVREHGATWCMMMGGLQKFLWDREPQADDRKHNLRLTWGGPFPVDRAKFEARFGLKTYYCYGLSEAGMLSFQSLADSGPAGSCGKIRKSLFDVEILDVNDDSLPVGDVGEIVCRPVEPGIMFDGYFGMPEYTLKCFRNFWFHTGDLGRIDSNGYLYFLERKKYVIKHGGENILPAEIEEVVHEHPAVQECIAIGVPNDVGEDDVNIFIVVMPGKSLTGQDVLEFCHGRMAKWMVPSHVELVTDLPRTTTSKPALALLHQADKHSNQNGDRRNATNKI